MGGPARVWGQRLRCLFTALLACLFVLSFGGALSLTAPPAAASDYSAYDDDADDCDDDDADCDDDDDGDDCDDDDDDDCDDDDDGDDCDDDDDSDCGESTTTTPAAPERSSDPTTTTTAPTAVTTSPPPPPPAATGDGGGEVAAAAPPLAPNPTTTPQAPPTTEIAPPTTTAFDASVLGFVVESDSDASGGTDADEVASSIGGNLLPPGDGWSGGEIAKVVVGLLLAALGLTLHLIGTRRRRLQT